MTDNTLKCFDYDKSGIIKISFCLRRWRQRVTAAGEGATPMSFLLHKPVVFVLISPTLKGVVEKPRTVNILL